MGIREKRKESNVSSKSLMKSLTSPLSSLTNVSNFQKQLLAKQFPLVMSALWNGADKLGPNDTIEPVINQGTLGIGFIGLAECLIAPIGKHHGESDEAQALGLK